MGVFSIANLFIRRPVLTTVVTLLIVLMGAISIPMLPVNNLPDIAPVKVNVTSAYVGADAQTVEDTVTSALERQINGVDGMEYITSASSNDGISSIGVFFKTGSDKDINQVNVQNRVAVVQPSLPDVIKQTGVTVRASSASTLLVYGFNAENDEYDNIFISNYLDLYLVDELKRVPGVGDLAILGERTYAMRLWLDPNAMAARGMTAGDVVAALQSQNVQVGVGALGNEPAPSDQAANFPVRVRGKLRDEKEFAAVVLKTLPNGAVVQVKDVGRVELGAQNYTASTLVDGKSGVAISIAQAPGSNAVDVADQIKERIHELENSFPPGLKATLVFDVTEFIEASQEEVLHTLLEAIALVVLVIFIFLQDWRTTLIPAIAIPVSLLGTMAFALIMGFSINTLTMFGLVLATGLVVDDGIVVVEAIAAKMEETGMGARQAAFEAMGEITGAVISMSLVLMAVFVPVSFFPGATGVMYKQFALIIVFSILISTFNALSFSPSMSALLLQPHHGEGRGPLAWFFRKFNQGFGWVIDRYGKLLNALIRVRMLVIGAFILGLIATVMIYKTVPSGFIPEEDQGLFLGIVQAPEGVALKYTDRVGTEVQRILQTYPEVESSVMVTGYGLDGSGPNKGTFFAKLKPWAERQTPEQSAAGILARLNHDFAQNQDAIIQAFSPPAVPGFSATGGFEFMLQDRSGGKLSFDEFLASANDIIAKANQHPALKGVFTQFTTSTPQYEIDFDRARLNAQNIDFGQALSTLSTYIGSRYVNDFTLGQRSYRVYVQADQDYRSTLDDLRQVYIRTRDGELVQLNAVATIQPIVGPSIINHFNLFRSIKIQGQPAPGSSSGEAIAAIDQIFKEVASPDLGYEWTGLSREEVKSGGQAGAIFGLGILVVFMVLAAQYESYIDPIIILLTVPLAIFGALLFVLLRGLVNDLYCQIAMVMLIGLAAKNAILIVEFANQSRKQGMTIAQAAIHASQQRFRPILMTALAALVGFYPLVVASGAGAASRWSLGTAVFGGLLIATIVNYLITPVLYVVIKNLELQFLKGEPPSDQPPQGPDRAPFDGATSQPPALADLPSPTVRLEGEGTA
ncbi:efflux RND transporter permease subunit [Nodosilinea sp. E11]|uniref:efflux RND transporter permease subunit n=1 Tax=Nodosilinea sp. E11 TaxID=3037479 RepID=UPI0029342FB9|nr:efflux RND transporter permease subunit [Nodosilinea sp. E11]WOD37029.1 efflux RND transporter permease subunit [Nodosilinea sp. E11]